MRDERGRRALSEPRALANGPAWRKPREGAAMTIEITVPRLGWSMEEGTFAGWLKRDGEFVRKGDVLFSLEGDKATQEIESFEDGILRLLPDGPRPGDTVRVGQVLAHLVSR